VLHDTSTSISTPSLDAERKRQQAAWAQKAMAAASQPVKPASPSI